MAVSPPSPPEGKALDSKFSGQRGQILSGAFLRVEGPGLLNIAIFGGRAEGEESRNRVFWES